MSDRRVFDLTRAGLERAHHHFAGVDPNPALDRRAAVGYHFGRIPFQLLLQAQRRVQRALRMVFMRRGRAEQRENAIAGGLHDIAVVAPHRVDHELKRRVDDRVGFFGVQLLHQLGRARDVGEQRGYRLALAVERCR